MRERLILIDSNSLIYRGFFAIPPLTTTKGELSNATFGFASIFLKAIEEIRPQHIAAAFDLPGKTWRHEADATYKVTRKPMPDELRPQFERCKELLTRFAVPMYSLPGYEADDVIGALSRQADAAGLEAIIVSGDLDPLQLVTPNIKLFTTRMGFQNTVVYDEARIFERYGLRPSQMVDFKALKGDTTDNIPGVPGVGEKTAAKLIAENGNIEGVYTDLTRELVAEGTKIRDVHRDARLLHLHQHVDQRQLDIVEQPSHVEPVEVLIEQSPQSSRRDRSGARAHDALVERGGAVRVLPIGHRQDRNLE